MNHPDVLPGRVPHRILVISHVARGKRVYGMISSAPGVVTSVPVRTMLAEDDLGGEDGLASRFLGTKSFPRTISG